MDNHPLKGQMEGKHAVSLTYSRRTVLILTLEEGEIVMPDIGIHDQASPIADHTHSSGKV